MNFLSTLNKFEKEPLFKIGKWDLDSLLNDDFGETYLTHKSLGVSSLNEVKAIHSAQQLIHKIDLMNKR